MQTVNVSFRAWSRVLIAAAVAMIASPATASTWMTIAPDGKVGVRELAVSQAPQVVVDWYDDSGVELTVDIRGVGLVHEETKGGAFVAVGWPEVSFAGKIGEPELPVVRRFVIVPEGASVELEIASSRGTVIDLEAVGFGQPVVPMQEPIPLMPGARERAPFHYAAAAYAVDQLLPAERAALTELGMVRGRRLHLLEVYPVAYNAASGTLMAWSHIEVSIRFHGGRKSVDRLGPVPPLTGVLLNPPPPSGPIGRGSGNYLIVAGSVYAGSAPMTEFASAKTAQDFEVTTHSVAPGTTKEAIKAYIESLWGTPDAPDYLLLVGDVDVIPNWIGQGISEAGTDLPYSCMDGGDDWYPDIPQGRFSVNSVSQLQDVVDKTLFIEEGNFADPGYLQRAVFVSGMDTLSGDEATHNWVIDTYMDEEGFTSDKLYQRTYGATTQDVRDSFNGGRLIGAFYGHAGAGVGGDRVWMNGPPFDRPDVHGLDGGAICALLLHFTCNVGRYHLWDECFTEAWLRSPNRGAAVNIGPSRFVYSPTHHGEPGWAETSNLEKFVFDALYQDGIREAGPAMQTALYRLLAIYGPGNSVCRDYFEEFNVMGDPSLRVPELAKNYLILSPEAYSTSAPLRQFVNAKTAQGFDVELHAVLAGTSNAQIKSYIEGLWGTSSAPSYILVVGDTSGSTATYNTIPHWVGGGTRNATTDLPYACMNGGVEWYPDIAIGRFSVSSVVELQFVVDKTLFVEAGSFSDPDYVKRGAFLANPSTYGTAEPTHNWVIENYFDPNDYDGIKIYSAQGGSTQDVTDAVNAGAMFTVYFGHSSSGGWWDPSFDQANVQALSNVGLYGLVFAWSCNTAHFDYDECFGETWLREEEKGAAAYISASDYIYWGSAEAWEPSVIHEKSFFAAFFEDGIWEVGPAWQAGLYRFLTEYGAWDGNLQNRPQQNEEVIRNFFEEFVLLGDPSLRLPQAQRFTLDPTPTSVDLCCPPDDEIIYTIEVGRQGGFDQDVTLQAAGTPPGATVEFDVNTQVPHFTSRLTIGNLSGATPGWYNIEITGTAGGGMERTTVVTLGVATAAPGGVTLTSPANGADDVSRSPTLIWQPSSQGFEYVLDVATDAGFTSVVYHATETDTNHTVDIVLDSTTVYYWHVRAVNGCGESNFSSTFSFSTMDQGDYFTEEFINDFDLDGFMVAFIPDGSGDYYDMCGSDIIRLPTNPFGGNTLAISEDSYAAVTPSGEKQVQLYGTSYTTCYVGDNGYITFTGGDTDWTQTLADHFNMPRISGLFDDLSVPHGGTISWKQLTDRVAVTWDDVPEYPDVGSNTFQIEMFFNGEIHISWVGVDSTGSIVGLSEGNGLPADFVESNISAAGPCGGNPSFALEADPDTQDICAPADAVYTIDVQQFFGFAEAVTLSTSGEPAGATVDFSTNAVPPPYTSVLTVGNTGACSPGEYNIVITGTAMGVIQRSTEVELNLATSAPDVVSLLSPPNGESSVSRSPTLTWQASSQAVEYDVQVATDELFSDVICSETTDDTSYTLGVVLDVLTTYYWHVRATNACGASDYSSTFSFTTDNKLPPVSYDMLNGESGTHTYFDDAYDGSGDNTVPLAPLSGGLGDLTDGVIATEHWNVTPEPYVGWQTIDPTITFHFANTVNVNMVVLHLDDSGGGGNVYPPTNVIIYMGGSGQTFPVTDPPGSEPFAFTCADLDQIGDTLELTLADYNSSTYMMLSEVEIYGRPTGACCTGETCSVTGAASCAAGGGEYQGDGTDCNPDPCLPHESACLIISEVVIGAESGGCPRWIEVTNTGLNDFAFLEGGVIVQMDDSSDVAVDVDLSGVAISAGQSYVISSTQLGACAGAFSFIYGFTADFDTEVPFGDGNDRYIITDTADGSHLLDIYGEFGTNGTGEPWEYTEGYAYRLSAYNFASGQDFAPDEWLFGGVGSLANGGDPTQLLLENTTPTIHVYDDDCVVGDFDRDGDVDLEDFAAFSVCFGEVAAHDCAPGNMAGGAIIDLDDFTLFVSALTGPQ